MSTEVPLPISLTLPSTASRHIALKSKGSFRGALVTNFATPQAVVFESRLELMVSYIVLAMPGVLNLEDQPPAVSYFDEDGVERDHTFDFRVTFEDGKRVAIAVKPYGSALRHNLRGTLALIRAQMGDFADEVALVTDKSFSRAEAENAELLHFIRNEEDEEADGLVGPLVRSLRGDTTIGDLVSASKFGGRGYRSVVRHIARHHLVLRSRGRIRYESRVSKGGSR